MMLSMSRIYVLFFALIATLFSFVNAAPIDRRDVWVPPILYPHDGTVWKVGNRHNVTWDTSDEPEQVTNPIGRVQLRVNGSTLPDVLADGFNLADGRVDITVPNVEPAFGYQIVLFGDSGNWSPEFEIVAA